ncbi:hypothetical protein AB1Y20_018509 [Prymnesium parvum]|uniref:Uncharacterized protein n=1 Tax=Prymnesium parvum TaxID=97485 RepID=A0AB34JRM8_PRYPA
MIDETISSQSRSLLSSSIIMSLSILAAGTLAWQDCVFPDVGYFALDESVGISFAYSVAAMNGNLYAGGYTKGNFAFVGVTDSGDVNPVPSATLWGGTTSDEQSLYVAEVNAKGSMTKSWLLKGWAIQEGAIGHGPQTNSIDPNSGLQPMLDGLHIAVKGGFRQLLQLPDGTLWSSEGSLNTNDQTPFVIKLDINSVNGTGPGTTGWAKLMDKDHPGGVTVHSVDGDINGDMIVSYTGCASFDSDSQSKQGCTPRISKLSSMDGSEIWSHTVPHAVSSCRVAEDGSFYCGWTMTNSDSLQFGTNVIVQSIPGRAGIVKFDSGGNPVWARATVSSTFSELDISKDGSTLVVIGSVGYGSPSLVARIDTSSGNEGAVLWFDHTGVGPFGLRGAKVTGDGSEVLVFGQITGIETLTDATGLSTVLRTRGSFDVFVAALDAASGTGKYAMDGGGSGMEYFMAMAIDKDTHDYYIGGNTRSEYITWGDVSRKNVMYNGQPGLNNADSTSPVGSSKAIVIQMRSTTSHPTCLKSCVSGIPIRPADVKDGFCYIDRHCYANQVHAPYTGLECRKCESNNNKLAWSEPDTSDMCYIDGQCVRSGKHKQVQDGPTTVDSACDVCSPAQAAHAYSLSAGCELPSPFQAGCYSDRGEHLFSIAAVVKHNETNLEKISSLYEEKQVLTAHFSELHSKYLTIQTANAVLQSQLNNTKAGHTSCQDESQNHMNETIAVSIITVVSIMLALILFILSILILRERQGRPLFLQMPASPSTNKPFPTSHA